MRLDHVVHVTKDLNATADAFRRLGFHVVPGGSHPRWGTHNALIYFDLTYIELVAVRERHVAEESDFGAGVLTALRAGEGPATVALATDDIDRATKLLMERGLTVNGPNPGSRERPDGSVVAWRLALPEWPRPFLIQWDLSDAERRADLTARGALAEHPLGAGLRLRQVGWAVDDLVAGAADMAAYYDVAVGEPYTDEELNARCAATASGLLLCAPLGPGPVQSALDRRGEGPFLYDLTGPGAAPGLIDAGEAAGAWVRLRPEEQP